jgi:hypothetical protein
MARLQVIVNDRKFRTYLEKIKGRAGRIPFKMTREMAQSFKTKVIRRISANKQPQSATHNTPGSIIRNLHFKKTKNGHMVWIDPYETPSGDLIKMVEFGTRPHTIPMNRRTVDGDNVTIGVINHPGARPKRFWRDSLNELISQTDVKFQRLADEIVR